MSKELDERLLKACNDKHWDLVRELIAQGADVNATAQDGPNKGQSVLWLVAQNPKWDLARELIAKGADINATAEDGSDKGKSVLWWAVIHSNWDLARELIAKGADLHAIVQNGPFKGESVLWWAAVHENWDFARELIAKGADINATAQDGPDKGISVLWLAVMRKNWDFARELIAKGAEVNASAQEGPEKGKSVLWWAVGSQIWDLALEIIKKLGDNVNVIEQIREHRGELDNFVILEALFKYPPTIIEAILNPDMDNTNNPELKILEQFICPISHSLILYPVSMTDGITYEKQDIEKYVNTKTEEENNQDTDEDEDEDNQNENIPSPITRDPMQKTIPKMNITIANVIAKAITEVGDKLQANLASTIPPEPPSKRMKQSP